MRRRLITICKYSLMRGSAPANVLLGKRKIDGIGFDKKDYEGGIALLRKALAVDEKAAIFSLAYHSEGEEQVKYMKRAAELGEATAHLNLYGWYAAGYAGLPKDKERALFHLRRSVDLKDYRAEIIAIELSLYDKTLKIIEIPSEKYLERLLFYCQNWQDFKELKGADIDS